MALLDRSTFGYQGTCGTDLGFGKVSFPMTMLDRKARGAVITPLGKWDIGPPAPPTGMVAT